MLMLEVLKSVHLLCLLLAGAASLGNGLILSRVIASGTQPNPLLSGVMESLGKVGFVAIVVLWLTGVPLAIMTGAFAAAGWIFAAKLVAATVILGLVPMMGVLRMQMASGRRSQNPKLMRNILAVVRVMTVLAIILAVLAFN
jgi:uncharacterized membrane protein